MTLWNKVRWTPLALAMRTAGRAAGGIEVGFRHGFDSGQMLDYVYENTARGRFGYGRLIDRVYLDGIGWRAIRARKSLLKHVLLGQIQRNRSRGTETVLLDVAGGPGRYLQELIEDLGQPEDLRILCRDLDETGLAWGRRRAAERGLTAIQYERGDACDPASLLTVDPVPNLVVASGLYELLDAPLIQRSMAAIRGILEPETRFVFTTQVSHPQLELIANVLPNRFGEPWIMECRSVDEVEGYARDAGFTNLSSETEINGLFAVSVAHCEKKTAAPLERERQEAAVAGNHR